MEEMIRVLFCQRNRHPEEREIKPTRESFERAIGGEFDEFHFTRQIYAICRKQDNLPLNRVITKNDETVDIFYGDFFIVGKTSNGYRSLTDEEIKKIDPCLQLTRIDIWEMYWPLHEGIDLC